MALSTPPLTGRYQIEALRTEVTIAVERAESRASDQRANWAVKEANLTEQCLSLKRELEALQVELLNNVMDPLRHNIIH